MGAGQECRVCGVEADCVRREVDTAAAWYTEVLQEALGETYDLFQKFCNTCDRLISEFEEVTKEKRSIQYEIQFRLANKAGADFEEDADDTGGSDREEGSEEEEEEDEDGMEKGEISHKSKFMKSDVKIFEIDVKADEVTEDVEQNNVSKSVKRKHSGPAIDKHTYSTQKSKKTVLKHENKKAEAAPADYIQTSSSEAQSAPLAGEPRRDRVHQMSEAECEMARVCQYCLQYFTEPRQFYLHRTTEHLAELEPFLCLQCSDTFCSAEARNLHYEERHGARRCERCGAEQGSAEQLSLHLAQCDPGLALQCLQCCKSFANKRNLRDHQNVFHSEEPSKIESKYHFPCSECEKVFYKKSNLTSHMLRHSDMKPFVCAVDNCGKGFKREKTLLKHFQLIHEGIKDEFLCVHCGQQFLSQSGLRTHISVHTGQETVKRNITCDGCSKTFRCQADLRVHSVVHTKEKAHKCDWDGCGQAFSQKASLRDHMNVHEKRFQCQGCHKAFGRERYLVLHNKTCAHLGGAGGRDVAQDEVGLQQDVQQIIMVTTDGGELAGEFAGENGEVEMTQVQVVQSESGELAVTLVMAEEGMEQFVSKDELVLAE